LQWYKGAFQIGGSFVSFLGWNIFFRATLLKREKSSCIKVMIKSTDFEVNIFLLWLLEINRYIYYRQLRGKRRYSKGTSCNLYFGIFFMIIYFNFCSDVFLFFVFSGTSFVYTKKENIFFQSYTTNKGKIFWYWKLHFIRRIQVHQRTT
jgi:hypothetical protein